MKNVWKRELIKADGLGDNIALSQDNIVDIEQLSMDPEFTVDWIGTPFLLDIETGQQCLLLTNTLQDIT